MVRVCDQCVTSSCSVRQARALERSVSSVAARAVSWWGAESAAAVFRAPPAPSRPAPPPPTPPSRRPVRTSVLSERGSHELKTVENRGGQVGCFVPNVASPRVPPTAAPCRPADHNEPTKPDSHWQIFWASAGPEAMEVKAWLRCASRWYKLLHGSMTQRFGVIV